jgi:hypothetical protein
MDNIHVPCSVNESPAIDLDPRGRGEEWHGGSRREWDMSRTEKLLYGSALLLPSSALTWRLFYIARLFDRMFEILLFRIGYHLGRT